MKKILIIMLLLLLVVSMNTFAEWTKIGDYAHGYTHYMDFGRIKKKGNKVKIWDLIDFNTVKKSSSGKEYLSVVSHLEYDCEEEKSKRLDIYWYSGNMRQGEIVYSLKNIIKGPTESIVPGRSIEETLFKIACGKK